MTFWKTQHFKSLQLAWYKRLEAEGFRDAEEMIGDDLVLRQNAAHPYRDQDELTREIKENYYRLISQKVQETEFRNEIDRLILMGHCEGKKATEICEELKDRGTPRFRHAIRFTVRRYEVLWGLRVYTPQQLGKKVG